MFFQLRSFRRSRVLQEFFVAVRLRSFDDVGAEVPTLFDRKQQQELACCEALSLSVASSAKFRKSAEPKDFVKKPKSCIQTAPQVKSCYQTAPTPAKSMAKTTHPANCTARANASVRREPKTDEGHVNDQRCQASPTTALKNEEEEMKTRAAKPLAARAAACLKLRMESGGHWMVQKKPTWTIRRVNHRRLGRLLDRLASGHHWREANAVLSTLFAGYPCQHSPPEDRKSFMMVMELQKRFCWNRNYHNLIKSTYEIWLGKLSYQKKKQAKVHLLQLELALFYISQGKFTEAHSYTKFVIAEEFGCEPFINLIHGLILYQLWYADLPEEMQIKCLNAQTSSDGFGMTLIDSSQETEIGESSNGHDAVDIENSKASFQCSSESSVGNEKILMVGKYDAPRKNSFDAFNAQDHFSQYDEEEKGLPRNQDKFVNTSIYFASGLDKTLLPIQLKLLTEDPIQSILFYRKLVNEKYRDAVKHLRLALHSTPPLLAALLPLIQLLLLGDQVHEAFVELDKSCHELDSALPFRLKARLLQCFCNSEISTISSCYESALTRDPTCNYSMERLIKMHKTGNYSVTQLVETIAMHLDAVDGRCSIWEEFASCFLKLQTAMLFLREDCISTNMGVVTNSTYCNRIPTMFTEGETGDTWRLRCRWWVSRHFGRSISLSEVQAGEWILLQFKAACAIHLYGPNFEYVTTVLNSLTQQGKAGQLSYLNIHIKNPMNLRDNLAEL